MRKDEEIKILKELLDYAVLGWVLSDDLVNDEMKSLSPKAKEYFKRRYKEWWKEVDEK